MTDENKNQNQNIQFDALAEEETEEDIFDVDEAEIGQEWEKEIDPVKSEEREDVGEEGGATDVADNNKQNDQEEIASKSKGKEILQELFQQRSEIIGSMEQDSDAGEKQIRPEEQIAEEISGENEGEGSEDDKAVFSRSKLDMIKQLLRNIQMNGEKLLELLDQQDASQEISKEKISYDSQQDLEQTEDESGNKVIEGVFDGENMIGSDGQKYTVPMNYASKSKLVEGDILKLTITKNGSFVYKQIQPIERKRMVGTLAVAKDSGYVAEADNKAWKLLDAAVTYFKGEPGDEVVFFVPKDGKSKWAAVENIIKK